MHRGEKDGEKTVKTHTVEAGSPDEFARAFATMRRERVEALLVTAAALCYMHRVQIHALATQHQLPAMYGLPGQAKPDGLMAYGPNLVDLYRRAATYVHKIFQGSKPANLPIQQPIKFDFVINLKTAKALGLTTPPTLLFQAIEMYRQMAMTFWLPETEAKLAEVEKR